jgi:hypothetical protein
MKTLIVLLFCYAGLMGQNYRLQASDTEEWFTEDTAHHYWMQPKFVEGAILELYTQYEKECYNDSTPEYYNSWGYSSTDTSKQKTFGVSTSEPLYPSELKKLHLRLSSKPGMYYSRGKEPTFQGFISFLRKRGKQ